MKRLFIAALLTASMNVSFISTAHAVAISQTTIAMISLPSRTISEILSRVNKEVIIEAKKHALIAVQSNYTQMSPFLEAFIEECRAEQPALTANISDEAIINAVAGVEVK
ncbi:MAG: hypothetical protein ACXVCY_05930 [Pseudobdellovibrionaceae bacterium]